MAEWQTPDFGVCQKTYGCPATNKRDSEGSRPGICGCRPGLYLTCRHSLSHVDNLRRVKRGIMEESYAPGSAEGYCVSYLVRQFRCGGLDIGNRTIQTHDPACASGGLIAREERRQGHTLWPRRAIQSDHRSGRQERQ